MASFKTEVPVFAGGESEQIKALEDWSRRLTEELSFLLRNIGAANLNGAGLSIEIKTGDWKETVGTMGYVAGGVGFMSGTYGIRVTGSGIQKTADGGKTWEDFE